MNKQQAEGPGGGATGEEEGPNQTTFHLVQRLPTLT